MQTVTLEQLADNSILQHAQEFVALLEAGIKSWQKAGAVLVELLKRDKDVFIKINKAHPHISIATLNVFARIGYGQVYPPLLLDTSIGAQKLLECPRKMQEEFMDKKVSVAFEIHRGTVKTIEKRIQDLTRFEANLVFNAGTMRTAEEQSKLLPTPETHTFGPVSEFGRKVNRDIGYWQVTLDKDGNPSLKPTAKNAMAQPVRVVPNTDGGKIANIVLYIQTTI